MIRDSEYVANRLLPSGYHAGAHTRPGSSSSSSPKNRPNSSRVRNWPGLVVFS